MMAKWENTRPPYERDTIAVPMGDRVSQEEWDEIFKPKERHPWKREVKPAEYWHGRRLYTEEEMAKMDPPLPPEVCMTCDGLTKVMADFGNGNRFEVDCPECTGDGD
jgi:hypothetical protein